MSATTTEPTVTPTAGNPTLPGAAVTPPNTAPSEDTAYVTMLRREAAERRQEAEAARAEAAKAKADADAAIATATTAANRRIINAELRAEATKAGMVDLDGLKLLDIEAAKVTLDADGNVKGAAEALEGLKKAKPYLFTPANTGNTETPKPGEQKQKKATEMTDEEYAAAKARVMSGRA